MLNMWFGMRVTIMKVKQNNKGFSLVELVIVVVIIGVIAAIAVPRISRGARGASESAIRADLAALRASVDLFAAEHNGMFPTVANLEAQLTTFTDSLGGTSITKDTVYKYGPYLRSLPGLPIAGTGGITGGAQGDSAVAASDAAGVGWIYNDVIGEMTANTGTATDEGGILYTDY